MNRKMYWAILFNPFFLILYGYGLSVVFALCKFGNVARRLPLAEGIFLAGISWFIIWTIIYFILKKFFHTPQKLLWVRWILILELAYMIFVTAYFGQKIYATAQPYSGKLASLLCDIKSKREFSLSDSERDFLNNGLDGIIDALADNCGLDTNWELYTANTMSFTVDENGMIYIFDAFLYAFDEDGEFHSWLISYDMGQNSTVTVYLDGTANTDYIEHEQMSPLFTMIDAFINSDLPDSLGISGTGSNTDVSETQSMIVFKYSGYIDGNYNTISPDNWYTVTEDNKLTPQIWPLYSGADDGFILTIYRDDEKLATIITEAGSLETISSIQERESTENEINDAKNQGSTLISNDNGMTFYLDENTSMSLTVIDAAAGSRMYVFQNGAIYNKAPFGDNWGVAESIFFIDKDTGFILLTYASMDRSSMYFTDDGGETFTQVTLPVSDGEEDMVGNELGYTSEDMDYINTPYVENGVLYVTVSYDYSGEKYMSMLFKSEDNGQSWQYVSYTQY